MANGRTAAESGASWSHYFKDISDAKIKIQQELKNTFGWKENEDFTSWLTEFYNPNNFSSEEEIASMAEKLQQFREAVETVFDNTDEDNRKGKIDIDTLFIGSGGSEQDAIEAVKNAQAEQKVWEQSFQDYNKLNVAGWLAKLKEGDAKHQEAYNSLLKNMDQNEADRLMLAYYQKWTISDEEDLDNGFIENTKASMAKVD